LWANKNCFFCLCLIQEGEFLLYIYVYTYIHIHRYIQHTYPLDRRLGGPQSRSGRCGGKKNLDLPGTEPGSSSYTQFSNSISSLLDANTLSFYSLSSLSQLQAGSRYIAAARTNAQKTQPPLLKRLCWGYYVIATQEVNWPAGCCLATSYNILYWDTASIVARWDVFTKLLSDNALFNPLQWSSMQSRW
jgi:hypothetical protein